MKYVILKDLKAGMIIAKDLHGIYGELLLAKKSELSDKIINKLIETDVNGLFVYDGEIDNHDYKGIISEELKDNTVKAVRSLFHGVEKENKDIVDTSFSAIGNLVDEIINEISVNKNLMVHLVDLKEYDDYTYYHSVNVAALSIMVGAAAQMNRRALYRLGMGAILHDIGKIFIPKEIFNKTGPLTEVEFEIMRKHSEYGYYYLKENYKKLSSESLTAVLTHHERYDGRGYPIGLSGNKQIIEAKIICVCDNYDAMTSDRAYRRAYSPSEVLEHLMGNSGTIFDPKILDIFKGKIVPYSIGTNVCLSNGRCGVVIGYSENNPIRPVVRVNPLPDQPESSAEIYDLGNDLSLLNVTVLGPEKQNNVI